MVMKKMELKHNLSTVGQMWINDMLAEKSADLAEETWKKGRNARNVITTMPALAFAMKRSGESSEFECGATDRGLYVELNRKGVSRIYACDYRLKNRDRVSSCNFCPFYADDAPMHIPDPAILKRVRADVMAERNELTDLLRRSGRALIRNGLAQVTGFYCDAHGSALACVRMDEIYFFIPATERELRQIRKENIECAGLDNVISFKVVEEEDFLRARAVLYHNLKTV